MLFERFLLCKHTMIAKADLETLSRNNTVWWISYQMCFCQKSIENLKKLLLMNNKLVIPVRDLMAKPLYLFYCFCLCEAAFSKKKIFLPHLPILRINLSNKLFMFLRSFCISVLCSDFTVSVSGQFWIKYTTKQCVKIFTTN